MTRDRGVARRIGQVAATVRFRITALAAVVTLIVLTAAGVALVVAQRHLLERDLENGMRQRADDLTNLLSVDQVPLSPGAIDDDTAAQIVTIAGEIVSASPNLAGEPRPIAEPPPTPGPTEVVRALDGLPIDDDAFLVLSRRVETADGTVVVHVASALDEVAESTAVLRLLLTITVPTVTVLLAALVWWLVGRALRPVEAIRAEVADISGPDLDRRVPEPPTDDEIARLARTMNRMLDRVEEAAERQRRFVADASHELRSPLTRIRSEIEVDLAHPGRADLAATHRSVLEEAATLQRLVDDLLHLARSDAGGPVARTEAVDLDGVVLRLAERVRPSGLGVDTSAVGPVQVVGDAAALQRAIANLVDNAERHAGSTIVFTLSERDGVAELAIIDDGPGIPPEHRERVFERFARLDDSRHTTTGGTGLGLAIARDIARHHGGDITIDGAGSGWGTRVVITLPLSGPPSS
ncbi:MAG: ATP-binding protein [Acidimicrobiales bacterium]